MTSDTFAQPARTDRPGHHEAALAGACACRFCGSPLSHVMADLGMSPIANEYRSADQLNRMEPFYPLRAMVCDTCLLVQSQVSEDAERLFGNDYPYFSSYSDTMLAHARRYVESVVPRLGLDEGSQVVEVACNDGYLLRWFLPHKIPVLGIEPAAGTADAARALGIPVESSFFGRETALRLRDAGYSADLMPANNVAAHVPDINDFIEGFRLLLKPQGVATFEFHHLLNLIRRHQFDAIYHEHYYYHSLGTFSRILGAHELEVFDVEEIPMHGGSLRVYAQPMASGRQPVSARVNAMLAREVAHGLDRMEPYLQVEASIRRMKRRFMSFLVDAKAAGRRIAGYGAPAKATTILNYLGARSDFIDFIADRNPHKQGLWLPGTGIPILPPSEVSARKPDYLLLFAWNLREEIATQMQEIRGWGGRFVVLVPDVEIF